MRSLWNFSCLLAQTFEVFILQMVTFGDGRFLVVPVLETTRLSFSWAKR